MTERAGTAQVPAVATGGPLTFGHASPGAEAATLGEIIDHGRARLQVEVLEYLEGGAGAEITLRDNVRAFDRWRLRPAVLTGMARPDPTTEFLGTPLAMPCLVAPFGSDTLFHRDGHLAVARACASEGVASIVPQFGGHPVEDVTTGGRGAAAFAQMFPLGDVAAMRRHIDRVAATGCTAICVTVDFGVLGIRDRYLARRWQPDISHFLGSFPAEQHPHAIALLEQMSRIPERSWSWDDLGSLFADASLPFFVKGVLTAADALSAVEAGAKAVIVSNHGGRQLDGVPATLDQLGEVVEAVGELVPVGIDGGIRRGRDVVVALAKGANVVLLGRLIALALASAGEAGVRRALRLLYEELLTIMTLTGRQSIADIDETLLQRAEPD